MNALILSAVLVSLVGNIVALVGWATGGKERRLYWLHVGLLAQVWPLAIPVLALRRLRP